MMLWHAVAQQVKSVLSKILLCRTAVLGGHVHRCPGCKSEVNVYNSCIDRHCPQCGGARRADWLNKTRELLLVGVAYFQVVFTLPDQLSSLILGNRRELYKLLFHSAWRALDSEIRRVGRFQPAALMVLHTWNQQLEHHAHLHALVPGGGPSLEDGSWKSSRHPKHRRRRKPYLVDNRELGRVFREAFVAGLRKLFDQQKLQLGGKVSFLADPQQRQTWLKQLEATDWNVFIEGPPQGKSDPEQVLKYLARYMTGGPISDSRIISDDDDGVRFWARPKRTSAKGKQKIKSNDRDNPGKTAGQEPFRLSGRMFVYRWSMHILPKGFVRSRSYGGYHGGKREDYLEHCRLALGQTTQSNEPENSNQVPRDQCEGSTRRCPRCEEPLQLIYSQRRPSWRTVFEREIYRSNEYCPMVHVLNGMPASPNAPYD